MWRCDVISLETDPRRAKIPVDPGRPFILCVDDDLGVLSALRRLLREEPYDVATVPSAAQALAFLRHHTPRVVVSDERMPDSSGCELLAEVRQRWPWISRAILTAYPGRDVMNRSLEAGADYLLCKPWDGEGLKQTLRQLVMEPAPMSGGDAAEF
jgi:CheY-like chemotaxis protein